jgi:hypothetical protein
MHVNSDNEINCQYQYLQTISNELDHSWTGLETVKPIAVVGDFQRKTVFVFKTLSWRIVCDVVVNAKLYSKSTSLDNSST